MPEISLDDVIRVADRGYPDGLIQEAHQGTDTGDTLALFIAREIKDVYDPDDGTVDNLYHQAADILLRAKWQLEDVIHALRDEAHRVSREAA